MPQHVVSFLDEDHVLRLARLGLADLGPEDAQQIRAFFAPEEVDPAVLAALADGCRSGHVPVVLQGTAERPPATEDATVIVFRRGTVTAEMIASAPKLRLVQRLGGRPDGIDLAAARAAGIAVSCLPRQSLIRTAEHVLLLMMALAKRLLPADAAARTGAYDPARVQAVNSVAYNWPGLTGIGGLYGRTLGIIGLGEVGTLVAERARAFGMTVLYHNRSPLPADRERALGVSYRPLGALLGEADFVSLHASNTGPNGGMLDRAVFATMKPTAFLINTSRGRLVDEDDLFAALSGGTIAGAGLDVHAVEPRPAGDRFATLANVVLTPHLAGGSRVAVLDEIGAIFDNIHAAFDGRAPAHGRILP